MVSRKQKLIAAGAVLGVGLALALLFRREKPAPMATIAATTTTPPASALMTSPPLPVTAFDGQFSPITPTPAVHAGLVLDHTLPSASAQTQAPTAAFDAPSSGRPVSASIANELASGAGAERDYRIHVVHDGDTLERLAERYLDDGGRSLELFDLNRDVLDNPNLLEIGVELRIPMSNAASRD